MGDMSEDADAWAEAREGLTEVRALLAARPHQNETKPHQSKTKIDRIADMLQAYTSAKSSPVGSTVHCPTCGVAHIKTTYQKVFCSNGKTKRGGNCKDVYWNSVDDKRSERANKYMISRNA